MKVGSYLGFKNNFFCYYPARIVQGEDKDILECGSENRTVCEDRAKLNGIYDGSLDWKNDCYCNCSVSGWGFCYCEKEKGNGITTITYFNNTCRVWF